MRQNAQSGYGQTSHGIFKQKQEFGQSSLQTFDESKYPAVHAENESLKRCDIKCCKTNTTNYTCPICNRLRKVCPFSEQGKLPEQHLMDNTAFSRFTLNELTPIRKANIIAHNNTQLPANPLNMSLYPPMLNEIIYYPVIHNHYVSKGARNNPEMASSRRRGRSVIEQMNCKRDSMNHTRANEVMTPQQFKNLGDTYRFASSK